MKYTLDVIIDKPVDRVIELFDNPDNMFKWMEGLEKIECIEGDPGQPGAKSRLHFDLGKRKIDMVETILSKNLPKEITGTYETEGVYNHIRNSFITTPDGKTRYHAEQEFRFDSFMMKVVGFFMPGTFKKQSLKYMNDFKAFAEKEA